MIERNENGLYQLTEQQIKEQAQKQQEFLRMIHPFLNEIDAYHQECIELRPIPRQKDVHFMKSLNLWRLDDKAMEQHIKFLQRLNGIPVCLYYSVFTLDYDKKTYKKDGKPYVKGYINNQNALYTSIAIADFDKITEEQHSEITAMFEGCGIEVLTVFSGHGYQDIILLNEKVYDLEALRKFCHLLKRKGLPADENIVDPARVMRMPYSFNCKEFDPGNKYHSDNPKAIPTQLTNTTDKRYSVEEVFERLEALPDSKTDSSIQILQFESRGEKTSNVNIGRDIKAIEEKLIEMGRRYAAGEHDIIRAYGNHEENCKGEEDYCQYESYEGDESEYELYETQIEELTSIYSMVNVKKLPSAIQKMLYCTRAGYRGRVLYFLTTFLSNKMGLSLDGVIHIMKIWATRCSPALETDYVLSNVERIYKCRYKGGKYDSEMSREFGYIDFNCYKRDNKILIKNEFFEPFDKLTDGAVRLYFAAKLHEKINDEKTWTKDQLQKLSGMSPRTIERHLQQLVDYGFVDKKRGCKRKGEQNEYCTNKFFDCTKGFLVWEVGTLICLLRQGYLTDGELKIYSYLCYSISQSANGECWLSQSRLSKLINKKRNSISEITTSLQHKELIKKSTESIGPVIHCYYTLKY